MFYKFHKGVLSNIGKLKSNWFLICVGIVLLISIFFRFFNYGNRWGLAYDQAHDVLVARYALETHKIPLVGPFSSAGAFQTGGQWYWFIMLSAAVFPASIVTPWIILTLLSIFFVFLLIILGKEIIDKKFGIILGVLAAVSPNQIDQSINLTNQSLISIFSLLALLSMIFFCKKREKKYLFFLGFSVSMASVMHLQGVALFVLIFITLLFTKTFSKKSILLLIFGILLPLLPILIFDLKNDFTNSKNMLNYYLHEQYKISFDSLGRRWLTYLTEFWPDSWSKIIGGTKLSSYLTFFFLGLVLLINFLKGLSKEWAIIILSFFTMAILLRYVRTPLFSNYLMFLHPFVFLLTAFMIYKMLNMKKIFQIVGISLFLIVIYNSIVLDITNIKNAKAQTQKRADYWKDLLITKYPNQKFSIYDYRYESAAYSLPLVLFLIQEGKFDNNGYRIGFSNDRIELKRAYKKIEGNKMGFHLWDLNRISKKDLSRKQWAFMSPREIYHATQDWYGKK